MRSQLVAAEQSVAFFFVFFFALCPRRNSGRADQPAALKCERSDHVAVGRGGGSALAARRVRSAERLCLTLSKCQQLPWAF